MHFRLVFFLFLSAQLSIGQVSNVKLATAAVSLTQDDVIYNGQYFAIDYPNGDVPSQYGVCTDVVIRAYRKVGIDLQQLVHEDMLENFKSYPQLWNLKKPDSNIDHRRVPNLRTFFTRHGKSLNVTKKYNNYKPGDVVSWELSNGLTHIGIVSNLKRKSGNGYKIVHNIGAGQVLEDVLFSYKITGHYRYAVTSN